MVSSLGAYWLLVFTVVGLGCGRGEDKAASETDAAAVVDGAASPGDAATTPVDLRPPLNLSGGLTGTWNVTHAYLTPDTPADAKPMSTAMYLGLPIALAADGTFTFNGNSGTWTVADIVAADWPRWHVGPYLNLHKLLLQQSDGKIVDGPILDGTGSVSGFDIIYHSNGATPGLLELDFGRSKR
jgi:hypothetical protein